ncbi:MAG: nucleotide exchange factor GrpE [Candidatus Magasanikbacteria bacterium]|jgi:molecular chaperone GrpE|nr:nucleotide exchange factor GrpE [Candidatus Magasanikbacteria bacterium]
MKSKKNNNQEEVEVEAEVMPDEPKEPTSAKASAGEEVVIKEVEVEVNVDYKDQALRAQADYQNLLKETQAQRSEWAKMSRVQILEEFIPVYENFKKAFAHEVESDDSKWQSWKQGIGFIMKQFEDILKNHGVEPIVTAGLSFDPMLHEALSEEPSADHEDGQIIREVHGGYKVGDKILQAAKVVVCKN